MFWSDPPALMMNQEELSQRLLDQIEDTINEFLDQPSPSAAANEDHREAIEHAKAGLAKTLGEDSASYRNAVAALEEDAAGSKVPAREQRKENLTLAAAALVDAAKSLKLPIQVKATKNGKGGRTRKGSGRRRRMTAAQMQEAVSQVFDALPKGNNTFASRAELSETLGFDPGTVLLKMKREGSAISNGRRGAGGGWRRGKKS